MRHLGCALTIALLALSASPTSRAQVGITCTSQMSPGALAFGNYVPLSPTSNSGLLGEVVVACSNARNNPPNVVQVRVGISAGQSGSVAQRRMSATGSNTALLYNLYRDAAYSQLWTDAVGGTGNDLPVPPGTSAQLRLPVFGRIPARQTSVAPGRYSDLLVLTVRY